MVDYSKVAWKKRRLKFIAEHIQNGCALCERAALGPKGGKKYRIHVHHMNYDHPVGEEPDDVLRILCPSCHEIVTILSKRKTGNTVIEKLQGIINEKLRKSLV